MRTRLCVFGFHVQQEEERLYKEDLEAESDDSNDGSGSGDDDDDDEEEDEEEEESVRSGLPGGVWSFKSIIMPGRNASLMSMAISSLIPP